MEGKKVLVTGSAGFIGFHVCKDLLYAGAHVIGLDNLNEYYDKKLKNARNAILAKEELFSFQLIDIMSREQVFDLFQEFRPEYVINLAAQAGVRYSIDNPYSYVDSNLSGFLNIMEACRNFDVKHFIFASSSSVYGSNKKIPFSESDQVDKPMNLYAATKRANELMAYSYSNLYGITTTGIRFFSVYGPWGRPDMAYFTFTKAILENQPIKIYNEGRMKRDFTYIDDITDGIIKICKRHPSECTKNSVPFKIYNLGKSKPVDINSFIQLLEDAIGKKAIKEYLPMHPGEVEETFADITEATNDIGFNPKVELGQGIEKFISWYMSYFNHIP